MPLFAARTYHKPKPLVCRVGNPKSDRVTFVCTSFDSGNVTIKVGGKTFTCTLSQLGTDHTTPTGPNTEACYVGNVACVIGDNGFQKYEYVATQGDNRAEGSFWSLPTENDSFTFFVGTCDKNADQNLLGASGEGADDYMYTYIKDVIDNGPLPVAALFHTDDLHYVDSAGVDDSDYTGKISTGLNAAFTNKFYDFAIGYCSSFGMLAGQGAGTGGQEKYGRRYERSYVHDNVLFLPQWGNHEFGVISVNGAATPNGYELTPGAKDGPGLAAWEAFNTPLQSDTVDPKVNDTGCNLWGMDFGICHFTLCDSQTNNDVTNAEPNTSALGANQITDILNDLDNSKAFKFLLGYFGTREWYSTSPTGSGDAKAHLYTQMQAEYEQLFTSSAATPLSICDNPKLNGKTGSFFYIYGDTHRGSVRRQYGTQGAVDENFYALAAGPLNRGITVGGSTAIPDYDHDEQVMEYFMWGTAGTQDPNSLGALGVTVNHCTRVDVYGPERKIVVRYIALMETGEFKEVWTGEFHQFDGNTRRDEGFKRTQMRLMGDVDQ